MGKRHRRKSRQVNRNKFCQLAYLFKLSRARCGWRTYGPAQDVCHPHWGLIKVHVTRSGKIRNSDFKISKIQRYLEKKFTRRISIRGICTLPILGRGLSILIWIWRFKLADGSPLYFFKVASTKTITSSKLRWPNLTHSQKKFDNCKDSIS